MKKYDTSHNIKEEVEEKAQEKIRGTKFSMRLLFKNLSNNRYKPYFKVNSNIDFSVNDAAGTAILYGLLNSLTPKRRIYSQLNFEGSDMTLSSIAFA